MQIFSPTHNIIEPSLANGASSLSRSVGQHGGQKLDFCPPYSPNSPNPSIFTGIICDESSATHAHEQDVAWLTQYIELRDDQHNMPHNDFLQEIKFSVVDQSGNETLIITELTQKAYKDRHPGINFGKNSIFDKLVRQVARQIYLFGHYELKQQNKKLNLGAGDRIVCDVVFKINDTNYALRLDDHGLILDNRGIPKVHRCTNGAWHPITSENWDTNLEGHELGKWLIASIIKSCPENTALTKILKDAEAEDRAKLALKGHINNDEIGIKINERKLKLKHSGTLKELLPNIAEFIIANGANSNVTFQLTNNHFTENVKFTFEYNENKYLNKLPDGCGDVIHHSGCDTPRINSAKLEKDINTALHKAAAQAFEDGLWNYHGHKPWEDAPSSAQPATKHGLSTLAKVGIVFVPGLVVLVLLVIAFVKCFCKKRTSTTNESSVRYTAASLGDEGNREALPNIPEGAHTTQNNPTYGNVVNNSNRDMNVYDNDNIYEELPNNDEQNRHLNAQGQTNYAKIHDDDPSSCFNTMDVGSVVVEQQRKLLG